MSSTLAIETSCDDTSIGIIRFEDNQFSVDHLQAYSQIEHHQPYGGVVPEIAFRLHSEHILSLIKNVPENLMRDIDRISVTTHPGLGGSLLVGKTVAQSLGLHYDKPVIGVHHIYGHIFSLLLERDVAKLSFPRIVLTASGGHNEIYHIDRKKKKGTRKKRGETTEVFTPFSLEDLVITSLGKTLDDAAGECFDKVARMLGGPYPGGQRISELALKGKENQSFHFKRIMLEEHFNPYDFSFSGMKAQMYTLLQTLEKDGIILTEAILADIAYEFQEAIVEVLVMKLEQAAERYQAETIGIVGGVSANDRLFEMATEVIGKSLEKPVLRPIKKMYSTDNAAMIGVVGLLNN